MNLKDKVYVEQLEDLILHTLLPVYNKYYSKPHPFDRKIPIDQNIIAEIHSRHRPVAALLRKK